jgi:hypothetical protein
MDNCGQEEKTEGDHHHRSNRLHPFFSVPPLSGEKAKAMAASIQRIQIQVKAMAAIIGQGLGPRIMAMEAIIQEGSGPRSKAMAACVKTWEAPMGERYVQLTPQLPQTQTPQELHIQASNPPFRGRPMEAIICKRPMGARGSIKISRPMEAIICKRPMEARRSIKTSRPMEAISIKIKWPLEASAFKITSALGGEAQDWLHQGPPRR